MTNRSEEQLMAQVKEAFTGWEPTPPAGVQAGIHAALDRGKFWKWGFGLNAWTLLIATGAGMMLWGAGQFGSAITSGNPAVESTSTVCDWLTAYPAPEESMAAISQVDEVKPGTIAAVAEGELHPSAHTGARGERTHAAVDRSERLPLRGSFLAMPTIGHVLLQSGQDELPAPRCVADGKTDIWTQLQAREQSQVTITYSLELPNEE